VGGIIFEVALHFVEDFAPKNRNLMILKHEVEFVIELKTSNLIAFEQLIHKLYG
jgi:hypothetical protein